mmetsp:Transcript_56586/g.149145  ORF Transcript_56586/g.149145 Transcript_56586/m.149145 type:complete len:99 (-) Transcript_56586:511-807(-)
MSWFGFKKSTPAVKNVGNGEDVMSSEVDLLKKSFARQLQANYMKDLTSAITVKCFHTCVDVSSKSPIDKTEGSCLSLCCDRYLDAFKVVLFTLQSRGR